MRDLLPYYEYELNTLQHFNQEFARRYPKLAGRLGMADGVCEDPHIERLIQASALLNARTSKRFDDSYAEFTEALLNINYPHYARPFPACSIARFAAGESAAGAKQIARGTVLNAAELGGVVCKFTTAYDVDIAPMHIDKLRFDAVIQAPNMASVPANARSGLLLSLACNADVPALPLASEKTRFFIDADDGLSAALRDALLIGAKAAWLSFDEGAHWQALGKVPLASVGFGDDEALIPFPAHSQPAYRLLTEYFAFPEKFNFFDVLHAELVRSMPADCRSMRLYFALDCDLDNPAKLRSLLDLSPHHLALSCTPVVNLFKKPACPFERTETRASYALLADDKHPQAYDIFSIDTVRLQKEGSRTVRHCEAIFSSCHAGDTNDYWVLHRDELMRESSPGHEFRLSFVDRAMQRTGRAGDSVSLDLLCTNRDLPSRLSYGRARGDLRMEGGAARTPIHLLRKPSASRRLPAATHWRLLSHLSMNHRSLLGSDGQALREMLTLYDLPQTAATQHLIGAVRAVHAKPDAARLQGERVRGFEVRIQLDDEALAGSSLHAFAELLDHVFALHVHLNSFTRLVLVSIHTEKELFRCPPRNGSLKLV